MGRYFANIAKYKQDYIIAESVSPDRLHKVSVIGNGEPQWSFGDQKISIKFDDNENLITTSVANDGREADVRSFVWNENAVSFDIFGEGQSGNRYTIEFDSSKTTVTIEEVEL